MTTTLEAPRRMGRRQQAVDLLEQLPADLSEGSVTLQIPDATRPTSSFIDQFVSIVLIDRGAQRLEVVGATEYIADTFKLSAESLGVADRLAIL